MKIAVGLVIVAILGGTIGVGLTAYDLTRAKDLFEPYGKGEVPAKFQTPKTITPEPGELAKGAPKAYVIDGADFDFGSMEKLSTRSHTFKIKNIGTAPLKLIKGNTTCKCTLSSLSGSTFAPGEIAEITLEWTSKTIGGESEFSQMAEIHTNDPENPILRLKIHGVIAESIRLLPLEIVLNHISSNEGTTTTFRLYGFQTKSIDISDVSYKYPETSSRYELSFQPMTEAEYKQEKGAISGAIGTLTVKPGLPIGPLLQTILLTVKISDDKEAVIGVHIKGTVSGDIVVTGAPKTFIAEKNLVNFGLVKQGKPAKAVLYAFVKGPHRHDIKFGVGAMKPPKYFRVSFSEPQEINAGKTLKYLITIELLSDAPTIDRLGYELDELARIMLTTTHPETKEIPIYVRFGIE